VAVVDIDAERVAAMERELGSTCVLAKRVDVSSKDEMRAFAGEVHGNMVTLHEGEAAGDVQVVRILPDGIHVRYQGALFAVHPRD